MVGLGGVGVGGGAPTPLSLPLFQEATGSRNAQDYILERSLEYSGTQASSILELSVPIVGRLFVRAPERLAPDWILEFRGEGRSTALAWFWRVLLKSSQAFSTVRL